MKGLLLTLIFLSLVTFSVSAQRRSSAPKPKAKPAEIPAVVPVDESATVDDVFGSVSGKTYTNRALGFVIDFPDTWLIPGRDFEDHMKTQGFDLTLKAPEGVSRANKIQMERALERVKILVTAYRSMPGSEDNAILRISLEDLSLVPAVKDAVDYFDLMRSQFAVMKLPDDFKYSETQAERLGSKQFAFLDTSSSSGKKRMYATVKGTNAIMFTLTYTKPEDLETMRKVLSSGDFALK